MLKRAQPGQTLFLGSVDQQAADHRWNSQRFQTLEADFNVVHPMTGPVYIEGAKAGDTLKVTISAIEVGQYGYTFGGGSGFIGDLVEGSFVAVGSDEYLCPVPTCLVFASPTGVFRDHRHPAGARSATGDAGSGTPAP